MKKILFDSDVLIEHLRGNSQVTSQMNALYESQNILAYTPVSEAEIFRGLRSNERQKTEAILVHFECLDLNQLVGRKAGEYLKQYSRSHGLEIPDALIAATASIYRFHLCTFNWKHYPMREVERFEMER